MEENTTSESVMNEIPLSGDVLEKRKDNVLKFLKEKRNWVFYSILSILVLISVYIRTRNIPRLKDGTTGDWTLGPDLDPFLFLRWAKDIVENGSLMAIDTMRYVPIGYDTAGEMKLLSYMIAWFYKFLSVFSSEVTVTYAAILFPVVMAGLTAVAFFLFTRKLFYKENEKTRNIIALISTAFFILIPSLLPRTIAGIPEKESAGFFFIFIAFYFFLEAFTSKNFKRSVVFGILAGIATGLLALIWGGVTFVFMVISGAVLVEFLLGKIDKRKITIFGVWMLSSIFVMMPFSTRYSLSNIIGSTSTGLMLGVFFILIVDLFFGKSLKSLSKMKIPRQVTSLVASLILLVILASIVFGPSFITSKVSGVIDQTVHPLSESRFGITVAENRQPYFISEWKNNFGPIVFNIPLYFWLFFIGSVFLFNETIKRLRKNERIILTFGYLVLLICLIFSRYSPNSIWNGDSGLSLVTYFVGFLFFVISFGYIYHKRNLRGEFDVFKELNFAYILYLLIFTMSLVGARGAIRLVMVLGAISPVVIGFLIVNLFKRYRRQKEETMKFALGIFLLLVAIASMFTLWAYYKQDKVNAENFAPGAYQGQWQSAMGWVRENTQENAVFAHWWDYGYWVQSIGERATILDGGNNIGYWNHLMGRHVLTGDDESTALEFLYAHNGTHLLIDSTEIGKYTAYSSIGSDENYDKFSWISTFLMDSSQTQETSDETVYFYPGGSTLDEDLVWKAPDGQEVFLPRRKAGVGGILLTIDKNGEPLQPEAIFVYNAGQYRIPLNFVYIGDDKYEFESGLEAGIFVFPSLEVKEQGTGINEIGAIMYFSERTIHSQLANLYLFGEEQNGFKLVHTETNPLVNSLKQQGMHFGEFIYYQGFQGPIKIWEVNYPSNIVFNESYLQTDYPMELNEVKQGEYN